MEFSGASQDLRLRSRCLGKTKRCISCPPAGTCTCQPPLPNHMDPRMQCIQNRQQREHTVNTSKIQRARLQICLHLVQNNLTTCCPHREGLFKCNLPFLCSKFLKPLCCEQVKEPLNVTSAADHSLLTV